MKTAPNPSASNPDLFRLIADEATIAILVLSPDGHCLYANPLAHDLLECAMETKLSQFHISQCYPDGVSGQARSLTAEILGTSGLIQEIVIKKLNGRNFYASLDIKPIVLNEGTGTLLLIQDITLKKKLQREVNEKQVAITGAYEDLLKQNQQLRELDLAKNRFIAMTTHELRTPLSAMVASAEILKLKLYDDQTQHDEFVTMIYDQGQQLMNLVNDILDFAKIQSNKMDYYVEERDLYPTVQREAEALQAMAASSGIQLKFLSPALKCDCYFDEVRIRQVLANLINNAIKYNRQGGSVEVMVECETDHVRVSVKDTGPGIAEADQAKIFNEFETLGKMANHAKGTGLGLPISQRMIQAMGGKICLTSKVGEGSTFWIVVPRNQVLAPEVYRSRPDDSGDLAA